MSHDRLMDLIWQIMPDGPPGLCDHEVLQRLEALGRPLKRTSLSPELHRLWDTDILCRSSTVRNRYNPARYWRGPNPPAPPVDLGWPEEMKQILRERWARGDPTQEIADALKVTKDAVVGKAHRMHLPPRPSPIKRDGVVKWKENRLRPGRAKRSLAPNKPLPDMPAFHPDAPIPPPRRIHRKKVPQVAAQPQPVIARYGRVQPCCWPLDLPNGKFRYCDAPSAPGKPYCPEHCQIAYVPVDDRPHRRRDDGTDLPY